MSYTLSGTIKASRKNESYVLTSMGHKRLITVPLSLQTIGSLLLTSRPFCSKRQQATELTKNIIVLYENHCICSNPLDAGRKVCFRVWSKEAEVFKLLLISILTGSDETLILTITTEFQKFLHCWVLWNCFLVSWRTYRVVGCDELRGALHSFMLKLRSAPNVCLISTLNNFQGPKTIFGDSN
jgi:hypothetical protein